MASVSGSDVPEGPVLTVITKRLRALKKKYNRILTLEETHISTGKSLNKEQSDLLNSKPVVAALIDEYEKLRQPLSAAVHEELAKTPEAKDSVEDLLGLLYFASLFDVKPQSEFTSTMLTRAHERTCCLTYDYVTDDATELLREGDLDLLSAAGGMMVARPVYSRVSHRDALEGCVRQAGLWLRNADEPIGPGCDVTYADLREKLKKIMASDYFTTTPEMKAHVDVAAAVGMYNVAVSSQVEGHELPGEVDDNNQAYHEQKDDEQKDVQASEISLSQTNPSIESPSSESPKDEVREFNPPFGEVATTVHQEVEKLNTVDSEDQNQEADHKEQKQQQYIPRRQFPNQRGGGRSGGGRRGSYFGGRGGRGGGSSYQNGRSQQQYHESGYYPRNNHNSRGRGGGRFGSAPMNNGNHAAAPRDSNVEVGASS